MRRLDHILLILLAILFITDFQYRIVSDVSSVANNADNSEKLLINLIELDESLVKATLENYRKYDIDNPAVQTSMMTSEQQLQQQGTLTELYSQDHHYRLKAIFQDKQQTFALILSKNLKTGETELIKVLPHSRLNDYLISEIGQRELVLVRGDIKIQLALYQPES